MEEAEYCERLALMNRGRLVALDSPGALRKSYDQPIFHVRTDDAPRAVEALLGQPGVVDAAMFGRAVHVVVSDASAAARVGPAALARRSRRFDGMDAVAPSLEDVFVALVRREGGAAEG